MSLLAALVLGVAGLLAGVQGGRALARARGRRQAVQAGALLLISLTLLAVAISQSVLGWVFALVLAGYGIAVGAHSFTRAANGRVGQPLSPEETAAFLARVEAEEGLGPLEARLAASPPPPAAGPPPRPAAQTPQPFDEDQPPSL